MVELQLLLLQFQSEVHLLAPIQVYDPLQLPAVPVCVVGEEELARQLAGVPQGKPSSSPALKNSQIDSNNCSRIVSGVEFEMKRGVNGCVEFVLCIRINK